MAVSDVYRLAMPMSYRFLVFGVMTLLSVTGVILIWSSFRGAGPPLPVLVLWCAVLVWNWHVVLGIPYEIRFEPAEQVSFVALGRTSTVAVADLRSIKPVGGGGGFYVLRHSAGKIRLVAQFTGFHEVISRIRTANPTFETIGI